MSNLFEALTKGRGLVPQHELESLLDGTAGPLAQDAGPQLQPAPSGHFDGALSATRTLALQVTPESPVLPFDGTHWGAGEQYRILRTKINQHPKAPQTIAVTSAGPSDGKSVTSINLAGALSLKDEGRVLLIDADFRRSTISKQLGIPLTPGLAEVLTGGCVLHEALIQTQQIANLHILCAGDASVNPVELLDSSLWHQLIAYCRAHFKYIIIDTPPVGNVADFDLIQVVTDGTILVARPDHTDRQLCLMALGSLPKEKLLGVVLNCVESWVLDKKRKYAGYYGYYQRAPKKDVPAG